MLTKSGCTADIENVSFTLYNEEGLRRKSLIIDPNCINPTETSYNNSSLLIKVTIDNISKTPINVFSLGFGKYNGMMY